MAVYRRRRDLGVLLALVGFWFDLRPNTAKRVRCIRCRCRFNPVDDPEGERYPASPGYGYPGYSGQPAYPASPGYGYPGYSGYPANPGSPYGYQSRPPYSPYSGSGYGNPVAGYPGDRPSEDWSPGAEYAIEPAS